MAKKATDPCYKQKTLGINPYKLKMERRKLRECLSLGDQLQ
jgi:hypothetical protein